jgi:hypothetical protein
MHKFLKPEAKAVQNHFFCLVLPSVQKSVSLIERSEALATCPFHNNSFKMKVSMEDWWKDTDRGKSNARRKSCSSVTTSIRNLTWTGLDLRSYPYFKRLAFLLSLS